MQQGKSEFSKTNNTFAFYKMIGKKKLKIVGKVTTLQQSRSVAGDRFDNKVPVASTNVVEEE